MKRKFLLPAFLLLQAASPTSIDKSSASQILSRNRRGLISFFSKLSKGNQPWEYREPPFEEAYEAAVDGNHGTKSQLDALKKCTETYRESYERYDNLMEVKDPKATRPLYGCKIGDKEINLDEIDKKWQEADPKIFNKVAKDQSRKPSVM